MAKHLRIAFFTPSFLPKCSGAEIFHHNLASRLVEAGHHVAVVLPRRYLSELAGISDSLPYDLIPYPANTWSYFKRSPALALLLNRLALARLQRRHRFDLWHGVVTYPTGVCLINWQEHAASKGKPTPYLVRSVGDDVLVSGDKVGLRRDSKVEKLIRDMIPHVRMMIALSETMRLEYLRIGVSAERLTIIPNAVNLARFHEPMNREETRRRYGLTRNGFVFLAVGRNHPQKDYPTMLEAILQLRRVLKLPFELVIAGRDVHKLEPEVNRRGLQDIVRLAEIGVEQSPPLNAFMFELPTTAMIDLYRAADAFVMSSLLEGFSSALLEAMAAALPVIVTDSPGCAEFVREENSGLIVPPHDPGGLAQAMATIVKDAQTRRELSVRSSQRAARFNWPKVLDRYLQIYDELVGTSKQAGLRPETPVKPQVLTSDLRTKLSSVRVANSGATLRNFPDFLIVGPQRTGTTWLFHNLKSHPEIFLPKEKELYYFSTLGMTGHRRFRFPYLENYLQAMADTPRSTLKKNYDSLRKMGRLYIPRIRGEATASYAALPKVVIREIATLNPEIKAILMIRDPIDRAWSHARKDFLKEGQAADILDPDALAQLLFKDEQRGLALYRTLIENWRSQLQSNHLFVGVFDSISSAPESLLAALHSFLGVTSGKRYFGRFLRHRINPAPAATIPPEIGRLLSEMLRRECEDYGELLKEITAGGQVFRCY